MGAFHNNYKDFYYSSLDDLSKILDFEIERISKENNWVKNPLPPEKVFVINLTGWDLIIELIKEGNYTFKNLLKDAVKTNKRQIGFMVFKKGWNSKQNYPIWKKSNEILKNIIKNKNRVAD